MEKTVIDKNRGGKDMLQPCMFVALWTEREELGWEGVRSLLYLKYFI